jgi:oligoendopeptidase F
MLKNKRVFDSNAHGGGALGDLPEWDLSDLYTSEDAPELLRDLDWIKKSCKNFSKDYESKLINLDATGLLGAVQRYEAIDVIAGRIMSFASLRYYQLTSDPGRAKFMSDMQDKLTTLTNPLVFYGLEFNRLNEEVLLKLIGQNSELARYKPVFDRMRAMKPYQLSDELEKFLHDQSVVGAAAWNRLFDETVASLVFHIDGEELPLEAAANFRTEPRYPRGCCA